MHVERKNVILEDFFDEDLMQKVVKYWWINGFTFSHIFQVWQREV